MKAQPASASQPCTHVKGKRERQAFSYSDRISCWNTRSELGSVAWSFTHPRWSPQISAIRCLSWRPAEKLGWSAQLCAVHTLPCRSVPAADPPPPPHGTSTQAACSWSVLTLCLPCSTSLPVYVSDFNFQSISNKLFFLFFFSLVKCSS